MIEGIHCKKEGKNLMKNSILQNHHEQQDSQDQHQICNY